MVPQLPDRFFSHYRHDETSVTRHLLNTLPWSPAALDRITDDARRLVGVVREKRIGQGGIDAFMHEFELSSQEGVVLMCLAEALLRIPDAHTADRLIQDKLSAADWENHLGKSPSLFVNASTWALMLTGRVVNMSQYQDDTLSATLGRMVGKLGEPIIRQSVTQAMRILGRQFVLGRDIDEALERAQVEENRNYRFSYDMLGEAAYTCDDAARYYEAYRAAIAAISKQQSGAEVHAAPGISVKLSALHPRYEFAQWDRVHTELVPKLVTLAADAAAANIGLTIDAEEADRLELSLHLFQRLATEKSLCEWDGLGLAVQAYQKRALSVLDWLIDLANTTQRRLLVRLVKGAYWDTEIKRAQEQGLDGYPVFTRKAATDVSYLACANRMLQNPKQCYAQFATHNAHTVAAIKEIAHAYGATADADFEYQRLHGMGEILYRQVVGDTHWNIPCRVYAPVGSHEDLLAYLVRRLLENGANTSFVNRIVDERLPVERIIEDPLRKIRRLGLTSHPGIPLPVNLFPSGRQNSRGVDLSDRTSIAPIHDVYERVRAQPLEFGWRYGAIIGGRMRSESDHDVASPLDRRLIIGCGCDADPSDVIEAVERAEIAFPSWRDTAAEERAQCLERAADALESALPEMAALLTFEAGKTLNDCVAEVREAVDFCRYYALIAKQRFKGAEVLPGPTGEHNALSLSGRGVFACISPWNFPLAIFLGQISAALAAGNAVVAKPAEQTPLIAARTIQMLLDAGVPEDIIALVPGDGARIGQVLVDHPQIAGVAFTGSTETAQLINRALAGKNGPIVPLIAETGGQNAMIVDSSALPEQVVDDILTSSFQSAGQRCSALRVLYLQTDIADRVMTMLSGAMAALVVGDPSRLRTDVGPVIDDQALALLEQHDQKMRSQATPIAASELSDECRHGTYFAPRAYEIGSIRELEREVFGPFLHVVTFAAENLDQVIDEINLSGYGLTLGIHSRIDQTAQHIFNRAKVGNVYVNRNQIGAIVGVQPFGGMGLSGTGPKAGGPDYVPRFATERVLSVNTTAQGGNTDLVSLQDSLVN